MQHDSEAIRVERVPAVTWELVGEPCFHHAAHSGYHQLAQFLRTPLRNHTTRALLVHPESIPYLNNWYQSLHAAREREIFVAKRQCSIRLIHFIYGDTDYRIAARMKDNHFKWVATFHQPLSVLANLGLDRWAVEGLDAIITVGHSQESYFRALGAKTVHLVRHGVDCSFFTPGEERRSSFRIVTVGHWLRDFTLYFAVAALCLQMSLPFQFRLITGAPIVTQAYQYLSNVHVLSSISDEELRSEYRRAACLFLPLRDATANNALLEGMACGLPSVISDVGSVRDYIDESAGWIIRGTVEREWVTALLEASSLGEIHVARSESARRLALDCDWPIIARKAQEVYDICLAHPSSNSA